MGFAHHDRRLRPDADRNEYIDADINLDRNTCTDFDFNIDTHFDCDRNGYIYGDKHGDEHSCLYADVYLDKYADRNRDRHTDLSVHPLQPVEPAGNERNELSGL